MVKGRTLGSVSSNLGHWGSKPLLLAELNTFVASVLQIEVLTDINIAEISYSDMAVCM